MIKLTKKPKVIIMFGGVYSSLGKGIAISSIGRILASFGFKISVVKMDPYLNINPGNMAPGQHGEVYVTYDGAQTDLDLGNYERFIGRHLTQLSNLTSGRIYWDILHKEHDGGFGGKTVQVVPHVTDYIKDHIAKLIEKDTPDFLLIEVGGTVGDIESVPFIEALSQLTSELGIDNVLSILLAPLISLDSTTAELKTKPAQHSIKTLRSSSIYPNMLILRTNKKVDADTIEKLALTTHMPIEGMFVAADQKNVYNVPNSFYEQKIHNYIFDYFKIKVSPERDTFKQTWGKFFNQVSKIK
ncbi:MAG: CTP synthase, partial [Malacoplasma sp.]|nr:CTP synthase [Malacoplasma sp.]